MEILLAFERTHDAIFAEKTLCGAGIAVRAMNLPSSIRAGCGICLRLSPADAKAAATLLRGHALAFSCYRRQAGGPHSQYGPVDIE